jgi:hypothetical protein
MAPLGRLLLGYSRWRRKGTCIYTKAGHILVVSTHDLDQHWDLTDTMAKARIYAWVVL